MIRNQTIRVVSVEELRKSLERVGKSLERAEKSFEQAFRETSRIE